MQILKFLLPLFAVCLLAAPTTEAAPTAAELVPDAVVYFTVVPDMPRFNNQFYRDHNRASALPIVDQAIALNKNNPVIPMGPGQKPAALGFPVFEQLALDATLQLFLVQLPDEKGQLQFVSGCQTKDPKALAEKMEASAKKLMPILEWNTAKDAPYASETYMISVGTIRVSHLNGWTLVGTALPAMQQMEKRLLGEKVDAPPLSETKLWKDATGTQDPNALLIYFTNLGLAADAAKLVGDQSLHRLFSKHLGGIQAYSWSWNGQGSESMSYDKVIFTLRPEIREAASKIFLPVRGLPGGLVDDKTLVKFSTRVNLETLANAPALQASKLARIITGLSGEVEYAYLKDDSTDLFARPVAHWIGTDQPAVIEEWWKKHFPGNRVFKSIPGGMLIAKSERDVAHFEAKLTGSPKRNPLYGELKAVAEPFAVVELDTARIAGSLYESVRKTPEAWNAWMAKHGIKYSETLPELDLGQYMSVLRATAGFDGNNLVVFNSVKVGKWTNTLLTATTEVAACVGREQMESKFKAWRSCFEWESSPPVAEGQSGDDYFTAFLWSNLFLGPVETSQRSIPLLLDLFSVVYLATPTSPLGE